MTNLIATIVVCIVTNVTTNAVVERTYYNPLPCPDSKPGDMISCAVFHAEVVNVYSETERDVLTEAVEVKTLSFEWEGRSHTVKSERVLWTKAKRLVKRETWEEDNEKGVTR